MGITMSGSSVGGVIFPIMISRLLNSVGFGWAMRVAAFIILFLLSIAVLTARARAPLQPTTLTLAEFGTPFKDPTFSFTLAGCFLFTFGLFTPISYLIVQATAQGMSHDLASYLIPILNGARLVCPPSLKSIWSHWRGYHSWHR